MDVGGYFKSMADICRYFKSVADVSRYFGSMVDINSYSVLVEFNGILGLVESSGFLKCGVDFGGNLKLVNPSRFLRLLFGVITTNHKAFLLTVGGGK